MRLFVFLLLGLMVTGCASSPGGEGARAPASVHTPIVTPAPPATETPVPEQPSAPAAEPEPEPEPEQPEAPVAEPVLAVEPAQVLQGDMATVTVRNLPPGAVVSIRVEGFPEPVKAFEVAGAARGFIPVPAWGNPRVYPVQVTWDGGSLEGALEIVYKEFTEDWLWVSEEQEELRSDPRAEEDTRKVVRARSQTSPVPLWDGPFQLPLEGPVTTEFGEIRFVNGKEAGRHSGTDYGVPEGTPIRAPARGVVRLADDLVVTGGTIYLDHGLNLFTGYLHLSKILVEEGQEVEAGEIIGEVGTTGFSTGPHLHWMAVVGNVAVNPYLLLTDTYTMFDHP